MSKPLAFRSIRLDVPQNTYNKNLLISHAATSHHWLHSGLILDNHGIHKLDRFKLKSNIMYVVVDVLHVSSMLLSGVDRCKFVFAAVILNGKSPRYESRMSFCLRENPSAHQMPVAKAN